MRTLIIIIVADYLSQCMLHNAMINYIPLAFPSRQRRTPTSGGAATNEMTVSVFGDIGNLFRLSSSGDSNATSPSSGSNLASIVDTWSRQEGDSIKTFYHEI